MQNRYAEHVEKIQRQVLNDRNVITEQEIDTFLNPVFELHYHDPFLLPDMQKSVERIAQAIIQKQKIIVYSDYDADGIPGGVILHDFFAMIGYNNVENYIPHRHDEGFGLNSDAIELFATKKASLIITVDCGITDIVPVSRAHELGIDVIITDHHEPHETLPKAYAIIDPKLQHSEYPFRELCGAALAYKLVDACVLTPGFPFPKTFIHGKQKWLLDMVGIATLSDMVPLVGENRVFAFYGLKVLQKSSRPGLQKILAKMNIAQKTLSEDDVVFMITPRINAASRMAHPIDAFNALRVPKTSSEIPDIISAASELIKINDRRKIASALMAKEINHREAEYSNTSLVVIGNPDWKPGVLGLAANHLIDKTKKTSFVWGKEDAPHIKGSVRSTRGDDVVEIMKLASDIHPTLFINYGGHTASGGFSVDTQHIHILQEILQQAYEKYRSLPEVVERHQKHSLEQGSDEKAISVPISDISVDLYKAIHQLAPFGMANTKPVFLFEHVTVAYIKHFGKNKEHVELCITDHTSFEKVVCIAFFAKDPIYNSLKQHDRLHVYGSLEYSFFGGTQKQRVRIIRVVLP